MRPSTKQPHRTQSLILVNAAIAREIPDELLVVTFKKQKMWLEWKEAGEI
jgi:hypothetical protein